MPESPRHHVRSLARASLCASALAVGVGCGTIKQTDTARTGTEQLLLTSAWDRALNQVDFRPLTGVPAYLDTTNVNSIDQGWVVSSLRQAMLTQGVLLRPKPEQAQFIVEASVGAYGTDDKNFMIGIPQTTIPPTVTGVPTGTIPELPFIKKSDQSATAKLRLFAYDRTTGQVVWNSGTKIDTSNIKNMYVGGFGPIKSGTIQDGTEIAGINLPIGSEADDDGRAQPKRRWWQRKRSTPAAASNDMPMTPRQAPMAAKSDLETFRP